MEKAIQEVIRDGCKITRKDGCFCCEECGEKLADLASCCNADEIFNIHLLGDGSMQREQVNVFYANQGDEMLCPYCNVTIGPWNEDVARQILEGNSKHGGSGKCIAS